METLAVYLLKSSALLALFFAAYHLLLRKETFFKSNRWYLLLGLVTSVLLPLVTFRKIIWIDPLPQNMDWSGGPLVMMPVVEETTLAIDWPLILCGLYVLGLTAFLLNFTLDFYALRRALSGQKMFRQEDYKFVDTSENVAPFSYFNYIVYNSSLYTETELANIIAHEKVHSSQNHTMDVLFARAFCIVFWFNPFVWLYKKAMLQNLEFIADAEAVRFVNDKKSYQITLLKVTAHENCVDITNHFYQSLIKKRIVMLNKNQSKKSSSWKYFLIVPALVAFLLYFQVKVVAQEREVTESMLQHETQLIVDKNSSDADLKRQAERIKKEHGVTLKFSKVKRNSQGEITCIKATYKDANGQKGTTQVSGNEPIQPFRFYKKDDGAMGFGTGRGNNIRIASAGRHFAPGPGDDFVFSFGGDDDIDIEIPEAPEAPEWPGVPEWPEAPHPSDSLFFPSGKNLACVMPRGKSVVIRDKDGKKTVVVDGKVMTGADAEKVIAGMEPIIINGEDVLKKGGTYTYSYSDDDRAIVIDAERISADAMKRAHAAMEKAGPKMDEARAKIEKKLAEMDTKRNQMQKGRDEEMRQAREEMEKAREELAKAKAELEKARAEMKAEIAKEKAKAKK